MRRVRSISRKDWTPSLVSSKHSEFLTFAGIVRAMAAGDHLTDEGYERLRDLGLTMNGGGRYRRIHKRTESSETICRTPEQLFSGEEMVRSAWRHAEPGRNALAPATGNDDRTLW